ncbi:MAG: hypothetical protein L6E13_02780 [Firmicutes bacterium]|nr:hypothetical protein [Bacillota bacterium]
MSLSLPCPGAPVAAARGADVPGARVVTQRLPVVTPGCIPGVATVVNLFPTPAGRDRPVTGAVTCPVAQVVPAGGCGPSAGSTFSFAFPAVVSPLAVARAGCGGRPCGCCGGGPCC